MIKYQKLQDPGFFNDAVNEAYDPDKFPYDRACSIRSSWTKRRIAVD